MAETTAEKKLPGVPAGNAAAEPVAGAVPPVAGDGLGNGSNAVQTAKLFGGNVGGRPRKDGLKAGSEEARAADRAKNSERMRLAREREKQSQPPPPLPSAAPGANPFSENPPPPPAAAALPEMGMPSPDWVAADFRDAAPELVELAEAWRVDAHTKRAVAGKLPRKVVEEVARDAAFPPGSKRSLSTSSPVTLAKMFNTLRVPVSMKTIVTVAPALVYIVVRDLQTSSRLEKLIADEQDRQAKEESAKT